MHVFALRLAEILIEKDESLNKVSITKEGLGGREYRKGENQFSEFTSKGKDTVEIQLHYTTETSETNSSVKCCIKLNQSRRSRKAATSCHRPAASRLHT
jgi:hypothetical protein